MSETGSWTLTLVKSSGTAAPADSLRETPRETLSQNHPAKPSWIPDAQELLFLFSHYVVSSCFTTPCPVARQAPLSLGFCRQEDWSGLPFLSPFSFSSLY